MIKQILSTPEGQLQFSAALSVTIAILTSVISYFTATKSRRIDGRYKTDEINQKREEAMIQDAFDDRDYYKKAYLEERTLTTKLIKFIKQNNLILPD